MSRLAYMYCKMTKRCGKMKKIIIPEDLKKLGRKKIIARIVAFEVLLLCSVLILYFADGWLSTVSFENKVITYIFLLILPFALSGFPLKLIDKTWSGTVVKSEVKTLVTRKFFEEGSLRRRNYNFVYVVKDDNGFEAEAVTNVKIKEDGYLDFYNKDDKVVHVYGCDYLYVMPKKATDPVVCVVCGMKNYNKEDNAGNRGYCKSCGHSLDIRFEDNKVGRYYH